MTVPPGSLGLRVLRGVELNVLGQTAVFAVNLAVTPLVIGGLGTDGYALYTLMWTFLSYLSLLNMGTGVATQHFAAEFAGRGEERRLGSLMRRVLFFNVGMAVLGGLFLLAGRRWLAIHGFHMSGAVLEAAPRVLACVAVAAIPYFALQVAINLIYGQQRFVGYNLLITLQSVFVALGAAVLLKFHYGLREIAVFFIAAHVLLAAGALWSARAVLRAAGAEEAGRDSDLREFGAFSAKSYLAQVLWIVTFQGDRAFIGGLLPLTQMGYYVVSSALAQKFNMLCGAVTSVAFPMFSELRGRGEESRLRRLYLKSSELSLYFALFISTLSFILIPQFMSLWLGGDFSRHSTWPFRLLVLANLLYLGTYLPNCVAISYGAPHLGAVMNAAKVAALLVLWPILIPRWGILGAAASLLAAEGVVTAPFVAYVHRRYLRIPWREFWAEVCWRPALAAASLLGLGLVIHGRVGSWVELAVFAAGGSVFYFGLGWWTLDSDAKELLMAWSREKFSGRSG